MLTAWTSDTKWCARLRYVPYEVLELARRRPTTATNKKKFKEKQKDVVVEARQGGRSLSPAVFSRLRLCCTAAAGSKLFIFFFLLFFLKENNFKIPKPGEGDCLSGQGRPILLIPLLLRTRLRTPQASDKQMVSEPLQSFHCNFAPTFRNNFAGDWRPNSQHQVPPEGLYLPKINFWDEIFNWRSYWTSLCTFLQVSW